MSQLNANTPYIECKIRKEFIGLEEDLSGYIFGVKSVINYNHSDRLVYLTL